MSSIGASIREKLLVTYSVTVQLAKDAKGIPRIHPSMLPQKALVPAIVYHKISGSSAETLAGGAGAAQTRLQFDCYGNTEDEADNLRKAVRRTLQGFRGVAGSHRIFGTSHDGERDEYDDPIDGSGLGRFIAQIDFRIDHNETVN